jgi:hypothetical protein
MLEEYISKKWVKWVGVGLITVFVGLLVFDAGIAVGERRERPRVEEPFSAYGVPLPHTYGDPDHGAVGTIESTDFPGSITIMTRGNEEESVLLTSSTELEPSGATSTLLAPGSHVIIIGQPDGTSSIDAMLIRVLPQ